jgi:chromosome segregation ATPase
MFNLHMLVVLLQAEVSISRATLSDLQSRIQRLQQDLATQQLLHEQCTADLASKQEELSSSEAHAAKLTAQLQVLSQQVEDSVSLEEHTKAISQLRTQMRSLQEQLASAEKEGAASRGILTSQQLQLSELEARLGEASSRAVKAEQTSLEMQEAVHAAEAQAARVSTESIHWQRKAVQLQQEVERLQELQQLWQQQVTERRAAGDQAQHVDNTTRQRLVTRIQDLEDQLMESSIAYASQQKQLDQHAESEWQLAAECAQLRAEVDRLSQQLLSERAHAIAAVSEVQSFSREDSKRRVNSDPPVTANGDTPKLAALLQEHRRLAERLQATQAKLKLTRARLAQAEGQLAAKHAREGVAGESLVLLFCFASLWLASLFQGNLWRSTVDLMQLKE